MDGQVMNFTRSAGAAESFSANSAALRETVFSEPCCAKK